MDRVAIVTGGASGIGRAVVRRLAQEGATVVIADVNEPAAELAVQEILNLGCPADFIRTDITAERSVDDLFRHTVARFGRMDVLVSNAITRPADELSEMSVEEWRRDLEIGLTAPYLCTRAALESMRAQGGGAIVYVSSVNAVTFLGRDAYSAAKAGLLSLTRTVASRYGPSGVRANAVLPATVATPVWDHRSVVQNARAQVASWYPMGRIGQPEDIASAVAFLASDDAAWISGAALPVDGGLLAGNGAMAEAIRPPNAEPPGTPAAGGEQVAGG